MEGMAWRADEEWRRHEREHGGDMGENIEWRENGERALYQYRIAGKRMCLCGEWRAMVVAWRRHHCVKIYQYRRAICNGGGVEWSIININIKINRASWKERNERCGGGDQRMKEHEAW